MPVTGSVAMVLGIVFSVILGAGLMARMLARARLRQMRAAGVKMARL